MAGQQKPSLFWQIHSGLPREGPGDNESTARAFALARGLPTRPRVLDIACGPGMQTIALAGLGAGTVVALDTHQPFLEELVGRAAAAGHGDRISVVRASMHALPFAEQAFDLVWCEGALYMMGFRAGLAAWRKLPAPGGCIAVTEPCWLEKDVPEPVRRGWADYPGMADIEDRQADIAGCGLREIGHFVLPDCAWWDDYYTPLEQRLAVLRERHRDDADALAELAEARHEIDLRRRFARFYGYVFFVMRRTD